VAGGQAENALGYWAVAYAASACRVSFRLLGVEGYAAAIYGEALFGTASIVLLWMGTRVFIGKPFEAPWKAGLIAAAGMGGVAGMGVTGVVPLIVPYLIAGAVFFLVGLALLRRGREHPGVGYSIIGFLFALYGGYVFVFSELASSPQDPRSYVFGPIINLAIGMVLLVVTQRKQQFAADELSEALLREAAGRRAAEDSGLLSEQRYRAVLDTTRSLIGLLDPGRDADRRQPRRAGAGQDQAPGRDRQGLLGDAVVDARRGAAAASAPGHPAGGGGRPRPFRIDASGRRRGHRLFQFLPDADPRRRRTGDLPGAGVP
jgi:hypothetical protein